MDVSIARPKQGFRMTEPKYSGGQWLAIGKRSAEQKSHRGRGGFLYLTGKFVVTAASGEFELAK
jgi:hypothetical protein